MALHLIKLCVGCKSPDILYRGLQTADRYAEGLTEEGMARHVTRAFPRRSDEVLDGGSLYWVMDGLIRVRQKIMKLEAVTHENGGRACAIVFSREMMLVAPRPRRPFQGWRYLPSAEAPSDIGVYDGNDLEQISPETLKELADIGVLYNETT